MANLSKIAVAAIAGVWASALGSAGAVAFVLGRAPEPRVQDEPLTAHVSTDQLEAPAPDDVLAETPFTPAHRAFYSKPLPVASVVDIEQMRCEPWRDLQMGSGRVQVCEAPEPVGSPRLGR